MGLRDLFKRSDAAAESAASITDRVQNPPAPRRPPPPGPALTWLPLGQALIVDGRSIPGGAVYVGSNVKSANGGGVEPALIDPSLKVSWDEPNYHGALMDYWPSYSTIDPRSRAAYLSWLADGRRFPGAYIGYVFLFFYGLERRLILDLGDDLGGPEARALADEIARLIQIYGDNHSFQRYASELLDFLTVAQSVTDYLEPPVWTPEFRGWEVPVSLRVGLGRFVAAGQPIPAPWALSYLRHHPEGYLRTPATRCVSEFDELFTSRYRGRFGEGLKIRPPATKVGVTYRPASGGFVGSVSARIPELPDISSVAGPIDKLKDLAAGVTDDLDAYSRFVGRRPDEEGTAAAMALLPDALVATHGGALVEGLRAWIDGRFGMTDEVMVEIDEVVEQWSPGRTEKLAKRDAASIAALLEKLQVGIEPDVRFGTSTPKPGTSAVLFRLPENSTAAPSAGYSAAMALVHLAAVVAAADGSVDAAERLHLARHVEDVLGLDAAERTRLEAHLSYLATGKLGMAGMKRRIEELPATERAAVGHFLVGVAAADGIVSPEEISTLTKLFTRLGLEEGEVYRQVHALGTEDSGPATVHSGDPTTRWTVPEPTVEQPQRSGVILDPAKVQARLAETAQVTALLTDIFADDETPDGLAPPSGAAIDLAAPGTSEQKAEFTSDAQSVGGLDVVHSTFVRQLVGQPAWGRSEVEELADTLGLPFLDAALDTINETSFDLCGEPLAEGDDPIEMNAYALEEMNL